MTRAEAGADAKAGVGKVLGYAKNNPGAVASAPLAAALLYVVTGALDDIKTNQIAGTQAVEEVSEALESQSRAMRRLVTELDRIDTGDRLHRSTFVNWVRLLEAQNPGITLPPLPSERPTQSPDWMGILDEWPRP